MRRRGGTGYPVFHRTLTQSLRTRTVCEIDRRVKQAAQILDITELLDRKPKQLSGGQRQRVAMGRAIVRDPKVFLFDEPLSNLDAKLREEVRVEIRELQRQLGLTTVMVTHDQEEALTVADRLVVMSEGEVRQIGTQRDLYERPADRFVAGFVGRSTFLEGRVDAAGHFVTAGGLGLRCPPGARPGAAVMALRPERMALGLAPLGLDNDLVQINGRVINSQPESDDLCSSGVMFLEFDEADRHTYQKHFTALKSALGK